MKVITILLITIVFTSCSGIRKTVIESYRYEMYIDFRNISYQGQNSTQRLYLEIDSTNNIWYHGKLIIENKDTFQIEGFAKGNHYVTRYRLPGTVRYGDLDIWCSGEPGLIIDSLTIKDPDAIKGIIKEETVLYRRPRMVCH